MTVGALALVESPAQLLNVLELARKQPSLAAVKIAVLAPAEGLTRTQLRAMSAIARNAGHQVAWYEPRLGGAEVARSIRAIADELSGIERLVVGDPFSGVIQVIISITRASEVTIVDDGTATLEFARQWLAGEQLSRWHRVATPSQRRQITAMARDRIASSARKHLSPKVGCHLGLFTCLPVDVPRVEIIRNDFGWVRQQMPLPEVKPTSDLVGTSLVEAGVVRTESYLNGVAALIDRYGVDRYLAHRKESDDKLATIEQLGLEVVRPALPLEMVARGGPVGRRVISFPSTVVHTLPVVLDGAGVEIVVSEIPDDWYTPQTTKRADDFLVRVTDSARHSHGLTATARQVNL
jgi:hypothetical protein